jgi:hypothetical protein
VRLEWKNQKECIQKFDCSYTGYYESHAIFNKIKLVGPEELQM